MLKYITLMLLLMTLTLLSSCKQDYKDMLLGVWESELISQKVGSDDELGHYNSIEITESNIIAKQFYLVSVEGGPINKVYTENQRIMSYQWKTDKQIFVEDLLFEIELHKDDMILKNNNIEITYYKSGK